MVAESQEASLLFFSLLLSVLSGSVFVATLPLCLAALIAGQVIGSSTFLVAAIGLLAILAVTWLPVFLIQLVVEQSTEAISLSAVVFGLWLVFSGLEENLPQITELVNQSRDSSEMLSYGMRLLSEAVWSGAVSALCLTLLFSIFQFLIALGLSWIGVESGVKVGSFSPLVMAFLFSSLAHFLISSSRESLRFFEI